MTTTEIDVMVAHETLLMNVSLILAASMHTSYTHFDDAWAEFTHNCALDGHQLNDGDKDAMRFAWELTA